LTRPTTEEDEHLLKPLRPEDLQRVLESRRPAD